MDFEIDSSDVEITRQTSRPYHWRKARMPRVRVEREAGLERRPELGPGQGVPPQAGAEQPLPELGLGRRPEAPRVPALAGREAAAVAGGNPRVECAAGAVVRAEGDGVVAGAAGRGRR